MSDVNDEMRKRLVGHSDLPKVDYADPSLREHRRPVFGTENPQRMNCPFWEAMVRSRDSAYDAAGDLDETKIEERPVWCFQRFGHSITELPDGRFIEIGGEHEDWYDPDFCIYNDVVVHFGDGRFDILGYPESVFPPTDFHSATIIDDGIFIIGNLGYAKDHVIGTTPVYRLDLQSFAIERVSCRGKMPGWIHSHGAQRISVGEIEVTGGLTYDGKNLIENHQAYRLETHSGVWMRV